MIKAVIFDMDGLMIDSEPIQSKSFETVLKEYGAKPEYYKNGLVHILGMHSGDIWKNLKEKHKINESIEVLQEKKTGALMKLLDDNLVPMSGLKELLTYLKERSIPMAVASSAPVKQIRFILQKLGIDNYFQALVSGEDVKQGKPHPDIFLEAARQLKVNPKYCLVLEDAESGVRGGKAAGMKVIAVQNNYTHNQDHSKADSIVQSLKEVNEKINIL